MAKLNFCEYNSFCNLFKTKTNRYEWNGRDTWIPLMQAPTSSSETARTKTSKTCLWNKRASGERASISPCSKVVRLNKQVGKQRSDSKLNSSDMPADFSVKQPNTRLECCWIKAKLMLATMKMKQQQFGNQRQKYLHNQNLRIQRRCDQKRARLKLETLFTNSYQLL